MTENDTIVHEIHYSVVYSITNYVCDYKIVVIGDKILAIYLDLEGDGAIVNKDKINKMKDILKDDKARTQRDLLRKTIVNKKVVSEVIESIIDDYFQPNCIVNLLSSKF